MTPSSFVGLLASNIINPLLYLLFGVAMIVFVWGLVEFLFGMAATGENKNDGKKHMLYGLIGLFIMLTASSIIGLVVNTVGGTWPPSA